MNKSMMMFIGFIGFIAILVVAMNSFMKPPPKNLDPNINSYKYYPIKSGNNGANTDVKEALLNHLDAYTEAMKKKDYKKALSYLPPHIVKKIGGNEQAIKELAGMMGDKKGLDVHVGPYKIIEEPGTDKLMALIQIKTSFKVTMSHYMIFKKEKEFMLKSQFGAISFDKGKKWFFVYISPHVMDKDTGKIKHESKSLKYMESELPNAMKQMSVYDSATFLNEDGNWELQDY
ncbi:MAG: hypothetical protein OEZ36_09585 [Spirochaetota bacterium]|nr:hypothetical protein [Spirochaetota bacterium]